MPRCPHIIASDLPAPLQGGARERVLSGWDARRGPSGGKGHSPCELVFSRKLGSPRELGGPGVWKA